MTATVTETLLPDPAVTAAVAKLEDPTRPTWMRPTNYIIGPIIVEEGAEWFAPIASDEVRMCPHIVWESVLLGPPANEGVEEVIRCHFCHAPRCGVADDRDPCMLVRTHGGGHKFLSGAKGG